MQCDMTGEVVEEEHFALLVFVIGGLIGSRCWGFDAPRGQDLVFGRIRSGERSTVEGGVAVRQDQTQSTAKCF